MKILQFIFVKNFFAAGNVRTAAVKNAMYQQYVDNFEDNANMHKINSLRLCISIVSFIQLKGMFIENNTTQ